MLPIQYKRGIGVGVVAMIEPEWSFTDMIITVIIAVILCIAFGQLVSYVQGIVFHIPDEHEEYLQIRDYSNCTKGNDTACIGGCVHTYRMCQIEHCGSTGIGW